MTPTSADYGFKTTLAIPYEEAIEKVTAALKTEGFGVLTEINVKDTFKKKIDVDFRKYVILGACNPTLAHDALETDLGIGLMLPCNVTVYENDEGQSVITIIDPISMMGFINNDNLNVVATEAGARLMRVMEILEA